MLHDALGGQTTVKCIEIGDGETTSIFERMTWQADTVCRKLHADPDFSGKEFNLVGISQGGLIARTVVETCDNLTIHTLFTFGSPHQGVTVYEHCKHWWCPIANHIIGYFTEWKIV